MKNIDGFRVGGYAIDSDQLFKITKIEGGRLYYQSLKRGGNSYLLGSIPIVNAKSTGLRPLMTKEEADTLIKEMGKKVKVPAEPIDQKYYKETVVLNQPIKSLSILRQLFKLKKKLGEGFGAVNRDMMEKLLGHLVDEFELVLKEKREKLTSKVEKMLAGK